MALLQPRLSLQAALEFSRDAAELEIECVGANLHREALAACGKTHAAFDRRSIPAEPLRFAAFCVAFRSKYTRYSSLTRLVSRAPRPSRRSREFHHRLLAALSDGATTSFVDQVSLAVMRHRGITEALTLEPDFVAAGFQLFGATAS